MINSRIFLIIFFIFLFKPAISQELFVYSESASNIPAKSLSIKLSGHFISNDKIFDRPAQRLMPEVMFGLDKKLMVHTGGTFSNINTSNFNGESFFIYAKYRFFSSDEVHKHFRMAVFANASHTNSPFHYDEIDLMGDKSGIQLGVIATQLLNKLALSVSIGHTQLLDSSRYNHIVYIPERSYQAMNYSLGAGYLLFPKEYTGYRQLNINLYLELLSQQTIDLRKYYVDLAPAVQFIFNSTAKLNIGYRWQLGSNMTRMSKDSWMISFERTFLNALDFLKRKKAN